MHPPPPAPALVEGGGRRGVQGTKRGSTSCSRRAPSSTTKWSIALGLFILLLLSPLSFARVAGAWRLLFIGFSPTPTSTIRGRMATPPSSPPPASTTQIVSSPSSLCSAYDERQPALGLFALAYSGSDGNDSTNSSPPFAPSMGDDRFPPRKRPRRGDGGEGAKPQPPRRKPPTHFVAVRIDRPEILAEVERVQTAVVEEQKRLEAVMVPTKRLHLTLGTVLHCYEEGQVARAVQALSELMADKIRPYLREANGGRDFHTPSLKFPGLGAFGSKVLFVRPCEEHDGTKQLREVSRLIWERLHKEGLVLDAPPNADGDIKLHGTIAKGSKMGSKARFYQIRRAHWERFERWNLEDRHQLQTIEAVQLLRMRGDANTGYYEEEAAWRFVAAVETAEGETSATTSVAAAAAVAVKVGKNKEVESQASVASTVVGSFGSGGRRQEQETIAMMPEAEGGKCGD